jgi:hypothetical protein
VLLPFDITRFLNASITTTELTDIDETLNAGDGLLILDKIDAAIGSRSTLTTLQHDREHAQFDTVLSPWL